MLTRLRTRLSCRLCWVQDARLLLLAGAFLASGLGFSLVELISIGELTAPAIGLMVIGAALAPVGAFALLLSQWEAGEGPAAEDDGFGGGSDDGDGDGDHDPLPPTGGLEVDWARFEQEFRAYAEEAVSEDVLIPA